MKSTVYLYNVEPSELSEMKYKDALEYKVKNGKILYNELWFSDRDPKRKFHVLKAVRHTEKLLFELTDSSTF